MNDYGWADRSEDELTEQVNNGEITNDEYKSEIAALRREVRAMEEYDQREDDLY